ncbi:hypothetical protein BVX97_06055 [bacterium E08(2017)]|nr:hypothetical protein BVX97_06055 [bacterium E08(2017)]
MNSNSKHDAEYIALRSMTGLFQLLPYNAALSTGVALAWVSHFLFGFRRKEAHKRIKNVFGSKYSDKEISRIAWLSWRNVILNYVEICRIHKSGPEFMVKRYEICNADKVYDHIDKHKGCILATPHMGNWDQSAVPFVQRGAPLFSIAGRQKNPKTNNLINDLRNSLGIYILTRGGSTMRSVIDNLCNGKVLAILPDIRMKTPDLEVSFLGGKANLGKGMAFFARKANCPIFPAICKRVGLSEHTVTFFDPIYPDPALDKKEDIERMTKLVVDIVDNAINEQPEQWFWYNKRWVLDPVES